MSNSGKKSRSEYQHLFGPVPSRRLGLSLGVDLVPYKTCSYDCLYCQIGRTTCLSSQRQEFVPLDQVLDEVRRKIASDGRLPDYVTLSGSGEPTLYSRMGELINALKSDGFPVAVITNGSLLGDPDVAMELSAADLVCPSLDAASEELWRRINRPVAQVAFSEMLAGLVSFRDVFPGKIWLEILLLAGINDQDAEVKALARAAARIRPDKVHLNTVVRPPAEAEAGPVPDEELQRFAAFFDPPAEVIADFSRDPDQKKTQVSQQEILDTLGRRPCTLDDLMAGMSLPRDQAESLLEELLQAETLIKVQRQGRTYYEPKR
jgi:wyosine [tRNA(Phe)-imidazoG37] synthetase (radical SAM superfamily)